MIKLEKWKIKRFLIKEMENLKIIYRGESFGLEHSPLENK